MRFNVCIMANSYQITLLDKDKATETVIEVNDSEYILDAAERQGCLLPFTCRAGVCISCTARLVNGHIDHDSDFLQRKEVEAGFFLSCKAYATSDCTVQINQEDALLDL